MPKWEKEGEEDEKQWKKVQMSWNSLDLKVWLIFLN